VTDVADVHAEVVCHRTLQPDERSRLAARADLGRTPQLCDHLLEAVEPKRVVATLPNRGASRANAVLGRRDHRDHEHRHDRDRTDPHQPPGPPLQRKQAADRGRREHH
jgi:hypothetical protein